MQRNVLAAVVASFLFFVGQAWGSGHDTPPPFDPSLIDAELTAEIEEVVMGMAERWNSQDNKTVLELWDKDTEAPVYLAGGAIWLVYWLGRTEQLSQSGTRKRCHRCDAISDL